MSTLGIDFGTSNTAAAVWDGTAPRIIPLEAGQDTLPTAVFFDARSKGMLIGQAAVQALTDGREGRFMRSLKSVLGTPLLHERRPIGGQRMTLAEVIGRFLAEVKARAEAATGQRFDRVLSGRPVHFHTRDLARDARAQADLAGCYELAGFADTDFMFEPEAAAHAAGPGQGIGLIVDIGGGTSDFTLFQGASILANHGIRMGGTDFDRLLSLTHVMPLLGKDSQLRAVFGPQTHTAPVALYHELATWATIPFLYTPETRRAVRDMEKLAVAPAPFARLGQVLDLELGHDLAFAVEKGKIAVNSGTVGAIDLGLLERGLRVRLTNERMTDDLSGLAAQIQEAALQTCADAGVLAANVARLVFVGGSSLMQVIESALRQAFPAAAIERANAFTAVVDGLAIAAGPAARQGHGAPRP